ncbi:MAG: SDR family oxidoreductase [Nitrososphaerales archaeon]|nr:SDR family oxidoreductase [Nitrososphaerales archaeon]
MLRILVTGGAGFIGSHLVDKLLQDGFEVIVLDDLSIGRVTNIRHHLKDRRFKMIEGDIREEKVVKRAVKGVEVVIHEAAISSVEGSIKDPIKTHNINVNGTLNLLNLSIKEGVKRFVFASSASVYGDLNPPHREDSQPKPMSPYAVSKLSCEYYCKVFHRIYGLETICLRYFNVYGPRQIKGSYSGVITNFIDKLKKDKPPVIFGDGLQTRDFIYISDVVEASLIALKSDEGMGEVFNIATGKSITINEMAQTLIKLKGKNSLEPIHAEPRKGDIRHSYASVNKAERILKFKARVSLKDGLKLLLSILEN